ncbi:MAG: hypothetical protein OXF88_03330 [Rhodobacteraceae bacterium]|nr:hypothetical protein [Paracoccaceae bacterium]
MKGVPRVRVISADSRPQGPNTVCLGHDAPGTSPEQQYALAELPGTAGSLAGGDTAPAGLLQRLAEAVMKTAGAGETDTWRPPSASHQAMISSLWMSLSPAGRSGAGAWPGESGE